MALSRDQILAFDGRLKVEEVEIPEWESSVFVRELTAGERDMFEQLASSFAKNPNALKDMRARVAAWAICDADGTRLFTDADINKLTKLGGKALDRILDAVYGLSGLDKDSVEVAEKN